MYTIRWQPSIRSFRHAPCRFVHTVEAAILATALVGTVAGAQGQTEPVRVTPGVVVIDHATHQAKVHLINTTGDTTNVQLTLQYAAPNVKVSAADSAKLDSLAAVRALNAWITNFPPKLTLAPHETLTVALNLAVPASLQPGEYSTYLVVHPGKVWVSTAFHGIDDIAESVANDNPFAALFGGAADSKQKHKRDAEQAAAAAKRILGTVKLVYRIGGRQ